MQTLRGTHAILTGATGGLGQPIAHALAAAGVHLVVTARRRGPLEELCAALREHEVRAIAIPADLNDEGDCERLVERAGAEFHEIDILVNNAGIESEGAFADLDPEQLALTVQTNVTAPMHLARLVVPGMIRRGRGHIVNMSSIGGKRGVAYDAVYCGTKAALLEWSNGLRLELQEKGVGVSAVCPGYVTGAGMFAKFGVRPPKAIGSCTPQQVARATVRVIKRNRPEVIVNSLPLRPLLSLAALSPRLAGRMISALGVTEFQRRKIGGRGRST
jgi:short-subunit dehydrogenase